MVKGIDIRKQILKASGRCFNCLAKEYIGKKCHSFPQCQTCRGRHHPSICDQSLVDTRNPLSLAQTTTEATNVSVSTLNSKVPPFIWKSGTNTSLSMTARSVLLQTTRAHTYTCTTVELRVFVWSCICYWTEEVNSPT